MGKKKQQDKFDDDILGEEHSLEYLNVYTPLNLKDKVIKIEKLSSEFTKNVITLLSKLENLDNEQKEYLNLIQKVESNNLASLLLQVEFSKHALQTLMGQLEAGGYVNPEIYSEIIRVSESSLKITMTVAAYVRTVPAAIRNLIAGVEIELQQIGNIKTQGVEENSGTIVRGTKKLLRDISEIISGDDDFLLEQAEKEIKESENPTHQLKKLSNGTIQTTEIIRAPKKSHGSGEKMEIVGEDED